MTAAELRQLRLTLPGACEESQHKARETVAPAPATACCSTGLWGAVGPLEQGRKGFEPTSRRTKGGQASSPSRVSRDTELSPGPG